jgi:hypothetical protein
MVAVVLLAGCSQVTSPPSSRFFPLSLELRALGPLAVGRSTTYVVTVRNTTPRRLEAATLVFTVESLGASDVTLGTIQIRGKQPTHRYVEVLSGLAPHSARQVVLSATPAKAGGGTVILPRAIVLAGTFGRRAKPLMLEILESDIGSRPSLEPQRLTIGLKGPAVVRVASAARYTVVVRNVSPQTIARAAIVIDQYDLADGDRRIQVTTDWPHVEVDSSGFQEAVVRRLQPGRSVTFHVTEKVPPRNRSNVFVVTAGPGGDGLVAELESAVVG